MVFYQCPTHSDLIVKAELGKSEGCFNSDFSAHSAKGVWGIVDDEVKDGDGDDDGMDLGPERGSTGQPRLFIESVNLNTVSGLSGWRKPLYLGFSPPPPPRYPYFSQEHSPALLYSTWSSHAS